MNAHSQNRTRLIETKLKQALNPTVLELIDESEEHYGHAGAQGGGGHFKLHIVSTAFENKSPIARHRMVYDALGDLMATDIHAISITADLPIPSSS